MLTKKENGHVREGGWRSENDSHGLQDIGQMASNNYAKRCKRSQK